MVENLGITDGSSNIVNENRFKVSDLAVYLLMGLGK